MMKTVGPIIIDLMGKVLSPEEREIIQHPLVGGIILFSRNYENLDQLIHLCQTIRHARPTPLLITVDQEGGRVQRFREGFTRIPPMGELGVMYDQDPESALKRAEQLGWSMASELKTASIDLSFAPVLDVNKNLNNIVVGDRAFHRDPAIVTALAKSFISGMHKASMAATGKHFPGHGSVTLDSHDAMPIDQRDFENIVLDDFLPFVELIRAGIDALMAAHIIFPAIDDKPVGFSERWLKQILRQQLKFSGVLFSDDLNMTGASLFGNYTDRASTALEAGCDFALICNNRKGAVTILDQLSDQYNVPIEKFHKLTRTLKKNDDRHCYVKQ